jgi:hypothetical protein
MGANTHQPNPANKRRIVWLCLKKRIADNTNMTTCMMKIAANTIPISGKLSNAIAVPIKV